MRKKDLFDADEPAWKFWNPMSGFMGGLVFGGVLVLAWIVGETLGRLF